MCSLCSLGVAGGDRADSRIKTRKVLSYCGWIADYESSSFDISSLLLFALITGFAIAIVALVIGTIHIGRFYTNMFLFILDQMISAEKLSAAVQ